MISISFGARPRAAAAIAALAVGLACVSHGRNAARDARFATIRPTLEEMFRSEAPLDGVRPTELNISADGRFISYRWADPEAERAETAASRPQSRAAGGAGRGPQRRGANLFVISTRGGSPVDLGKREFTTWTGRGSELLLTSGTKLQIWNAAESLTKIRDVHDFGAAVGQVRLAPDGRSALVDAAGARWFCNFGSEAAPASVQFPADVAAERIYYLQNGFGILGRARAETAAPASSPESRAASAPASRPESGPTSRPVSREYRYILTGFDGAERARTTFELPEGVELDQSSPSADGESLILLFGERNRERRGGFVADFLTERVTTRPARGANASERWTRQMIRAARVGADLLQEIPGITPALERQRFEIVTSRGTAPGWPAFFIAKSAEDRTERKLFAVFSEAVASPSSAFRSRELLTIPGPVGGIEQFATGAGLPILLSEASGRARGYLYDPDKGMRAFTPENLDVQWCQWGVGGEEQQKVTIALVSDPETPWRRRFWRMFRSGAPHAPLPGEDYYISNPELSRDGTTLTFFASQIGEAEDIYSMPADGSGAPRRLTFTAPARETRPGASVPMSIFNYPSADGTRIWSFLYEPPPGVARNGAAVIFLHGAGYLQQVRASTGFPGYSDNHYFHTRLAQMGYVVLAPDYRGSAGYGRKFRTDVYQKLGIPESDDIFAAKQWLVKNAGVDPARIGLYGGSYGGYLTLMCLFRYPEEFGCGAALRSVTDWKTYSPEYTRPLFGGGPEEYPEAYLNTSPIHFASKLARPLLLLHGMEDDNVFVQDTIALVEKLQIERKTELFELMLYPSQNHTFTSHHSWVDEYLRIEKFFEKHLLNGGRP